MEFSHHFGSFVYFLVKLFKSVIWVILDGSDLLFLRHFTISYLDLDKKHEKLHKKSQFNAKLKRFFEGKFLFKVGKFFNPRKMLQKLIKMVGFALIFDLSFQLGVGKHRVFNFFFKPPSKILLNRTRMLHLAQCAQCGSHLTVFKEFTFVASFVA
jgi:hypothetical protein